MRTKIRIILSFIFLTTFLLCITFSVQLLIQAVVAGKVFNFEDYSWINWLIQSFYWILSICFSILVPLEIVDDNE